MKISLTHEGKRYETFEVADLLARGIPQAAIDEALTSQRLTEAKAECRKRIYAIASAETQMNMIAAASAISGKDAGSRSAEEVDLLAEFEQSVTWVAAMRAAVHTLAADSDADIHADGSWPVCPAEVIALAQAY